jgi:hypothetical protein
MEGKTEHDFELALGAPVSMASMAHGATLYQWRSGHYNIQSIAVLFDANHRFLKVSSRYQVRSKVIKARHICLPAHA